MVNIKTDDLNELRQMDGVNRMVSINNPNALGKFDTVDKIRAKIADKKLEYDQKHVPYCARCARLDLKDMVEKKIESDVRMNKQVDWVEINKQITVFLENLDVYGNSDRFEKVNESEAYHRFKGDNKDTLIGTNFDFKCKIRACGVTVLMPNEEIDPKKKKVK